MTSYKPHPAADIFPLLGEEELKALAADIREHGQREPVVLYEDQILDGRNRWRACKKIGVEPKTRDVDLKEIGGSPTAYVISLNLKRRHLSPTQAATVAVDAEGQFAEEAKERQVEGGKSAGRGRPTEKGGVRSAHSLSEGKARVQAAKAIGAGQRATAVMKNVKKTAPEVFRAVKDGKIASVSDAARLSKMTPEKRSAVLKSLDGEGTKSKSVIAEIVREERVDKLNLISRGNKPLEAPEKYPVLLVDPPWKYEHVATESRAIENQYPTMALEEICALPVKDITTDDAIVFMWATSPKLAEAIAVLAAWGFTYRTSMVWVKDKIGMGYWARSRHELVLIATRGKFPTPAPKNRFDSVIEAPVGKHSAKPVELYERIEKMFPKLAKVEMFARAPRKSWFGWGNQAAAAAA